MILLFCPTMCLLDIILELPLGGVSDWYSIEMSNTQNVIFIYSSMHIQCKHNCDNNWLIRLRFVLQISFCVSLSLYFSGSVINVERMVDARYCCCQRHGVITANPHNELIKIELLWIAIRLSFKEIGKYSAMIVLNWLLNYLSFIRMQKKQQ